MLDEETAKSFIIRGVDEGGPAAAAGLQRGMLVVAIDGRPPSGLSAVAKQLYPKQKGDRVQLAIAVLQRMGNSIFRSDGTAELTMR